MVIKMDLNKDCLEIQEAKMELNLYFLSLMIRSQLDHSLVKELKSLLSQVGLILSINKNLQVINNLKLCLWALYLDKVLHSHPKLLILLHSQTHPQQSNHYKGQYLDKDNQTLLNKNQRDLCLVKDLLISHRAQDLVHRLKLQLKEQAYSEEANKLQHKEQACLEGAHQLPILCSEEIIKTQLNN